ncbi:hypothetical protein DRQ09_08195 [candidate division KSB1 bacterium]|nr:MAG: hypothetical protein DRQ09_08195 [candidate division KSB1 bacterium]
MGKIKYKITGALGKIFGVKFFWNLEGLFKAKKAILSRVKDECEFEEAGKKDADFLMKLGLINEKSKVLDVGCGIGRVEKYLSDFVDEVYGIDISEVMISKAKRNVDKKNVYFYVNDGSDLKMFDNDFFDFAFSFFVFQHISRKVAVSYIKEIFRVLKEKGKFLCQFQYKDEDNDVKDPDENHPWGIRLYSEKEIRELAKKGNFKLLDILGIKEARNKRRKGVEFDKCDVYAIMEKI